MGLGAAARGEHPEAQGPCADAPLLPGEGVVDALLLGPGLVLGPAAARLPGEAQFVSAPSPGTSPDTGIIF